MSRALSVACLALALGLLAGCGSSDSASDSGSNGKLEVSGDAKSDQQIADDLATYMKRNGQEDVASAEQVRACERTSLQISRKAAPEVYKNASPAQLQKLASAAKAPCSAYASLEGIDVADNKITLKTTLTSTPDDRAVAQALCSVINGSDVADDVSGHKIIGADGETVLVCAGDTGNI